CTADGTCTFTVIEGHVLVTTRSGKTVLLGPGESVTVAPDFSLGDVKLISLGDLAANDPFIADNLRRDAIPVPSPTTTTTTATTTVSASTRSMCSTPMGRCSG